VPVVRERRDRDVGDVVGVHERLGHVAGGQSDLAAHDEIPPEVLAEVLREPRRANDREVGAGRADGVLALLALRLTAPGQQHQPPDAALDSQLGERADRLGRAGDREVGGVRDIGRPHALQHRRPGRTVLPLERRTAGARAGSRRHAPSQQPLGNPASDLARTAEHQRLVGVLCVGHRFFSFGGSVQASTAATQ
jgi:hypothetical protein